MERGKTLGDAVTDRAFRTLLDTLMPGGDNWDAFRQQQVKQDEQACLDGNRGCPAFDRCEADGPNNVCSEDWPDAPLQEIHVDVLLHVLRNFKHYDRGDSRVTNAPRVAKQLLSEISELRGQVFSFSEGEKKWGWHSWRERNSAEARKYKETRFKEGHTACDCCKTDYVARFGTRLALHAMECHHRIPLSSDKHNGKTTGEELSLVCAVCHRLLHRTKDNNESPEELGKQLNRK